MTYSNTGDTITSNNYSNVDKNQINKLIEENKQHKYIVIVLTIILIITQFAIIYTRFNDNTRITQMENEIQRLNTELNKIQYLIDHNEQKTIIIRYNSTHDTK